MTDTNTSAKLAQFNEFFSIKHNFSINITPVELSHMPNFEHFIKSMPLPFKISSDMVALEQAALRPLQGLSDSAGQLVDYLNQQSKKIDLLVGYILSQEDTIEKRYKGTAFGGGGVAFSSEKAFNVGQMLEMKVFLLEENCAVYCIGEVVEMTQATEEPNHDNEQLKHYKVVFHYLREEDREVLVRTSLHLQSKQLQTLAKARNGASQSS